MFVLLLIKVYSDTMYIKKNDARRNGKADFNDYVSF